MKYLVLLLLTLTANAAWGTGYYEQGYSHTTDIKITNGKGGT